MAVEVWLRTNVRAVLWGMLLPALVALTAVVMVFGLPGHEPPRWMRIGGVVLLGLASVIFGALLVQLRQPRLAYRDRHLLVWLRSGPPARVPIEIVECFWLGQAPSMLPGKRHHHTETAAVVIRIADKATDWHRQDVKTQLGKWCEGYITIRGTWCEPLNIDVVNRLNQRLAEVSKQNVGPSGNSAS